jgi:hypothetical protein
VTRPASIGAIGRPILRLAVRRLRAARVAATAMAAPLRNAAVLYDADVFDALRRDGIAKPEDWVLTG